MTISPAWSTSGRTGSEEAILRLVPTRVRHGRRGACGSATEELDLADVLQRLGHVPLELDHEPLLGHPHRLARYPVPVRDLLQRERVLRDQALLEDHLLALAERAG